MTTLNQIVAARSDRTKSLLAKLIALRKALQAAPTFTGQIRRYLPAVDGGIVYPQEDKVITASAKTLLAEVQDAFVNLTDLNVTNEVGNTVAMADLSVGGRTFNLPVTALMTVEKYLKELRDVMDEVPTLARDQSWESEDGELYRATTQRSIRTKKDQVVKELSPATDKHPAQVQLIPMDVLEGYWDTTPQSKAIKPAVKQAYLTRIDELIIQCKQAREKANMVEVENIHIGQALFSHIVGN